MNANSPSSLNTYRKKGRASKNVTILKSDFAQLSIIEVRILKRTQGNQYQCLLQFITSVNYSSSILS